MKVPEIKAAVETKVDHIKCCLCIRRGNKKKHGKDSDSDSSDISDEKGKKKPVKYMQNNIFMIIKQKSKDFIRSIS